MKNTTIEIDITDLNNLGCGVGRYDGKVVFVKGAVKGDRVSARIIKENKSFLVGKLEEVKVSSPMRIEKDECDAPLSCGGCVYRHVTYECELALKREYVENAFRKAGISDVEVLDTLCAGRSGGYRNKAQYPVTKTKDGIRAGFYASKTHNIVPAEHCAIQSPLFEPIVKAVCEFATKRNISAYDEESGRGLLRHIYLRIGERTGQIMLCIVINGDELPYSDELVCCVREKFEGITGILLNINKKNTNVVLGDKYKLLWGCDHIEDELCDLRFKISPASFYQINRDGAELLYGKARELASLTGDELLLDLYCGTGTIGLSMARSVRHLIGIEIVPSAVECATENARANGIDNADFICADAGSKEVILDATGGVRPDVVVIDPPRKGSTRELIETLSRLDVPKVVYVSCDADTLARDCVIFREFGYKMGDVQPVDMFPRTGHVESVVCLTRRLDN